MIKLKLGEIVEAETPLAKLDQLAKDGKLSIKANYYLGRIIKKIQPELQEFYQEKKKIIDKYATEEFVEKDGEMVSTGNFKITDQEKFFKYMNQLLGIDVELTNIFPLEVKEIGDLKGFTLEDVLRLGQFIDEPSVEKDEERKPIKISLEDEESIIEEITEATEVAPE